MNKAELKKHFTLERAWELYIKSLPSCLDENGKRVMRHAFFYGAHATITMFALSTMALDETEQKEAVVKIMNEIESYMKTVPADSIKFQNN